jgi:hypothetical protein
VSKRKPVRIRSVLEQTLTELEGKDWGDPPYDSHVVTEVHRLRGIPLKQLRIEDLRLLIGQGVGLQYLVPIALNHVRRHPLAGGDFYRGDLLASLARVADPFWIANPHLRLQLIEALEAALARLHKVQTVAHLEPELRAALRRHREAEGAA